MMKAYILMKIRGGEVKEVVRQLRKVQSVSEARMTFGPFDAVAVCEPEDINHLGHLISDHIQPIPGILETMTCISTD